MSESEQDNLLVDDTFFDNYSSYFGEAYEACGLPDWYDENGEFISKKKELI